MTTPNAKSIARATMKRKRRSSVIIFVLALIVVVLCAMNLMFGTKNYSLGTVFAALNGQTLPGVSYTVVELRAPRTLAAVLTGLAFGAAGSIFQTLLRNQLASPDVIGVSTGASAAAVFGIVSLHLSQSTVSLMALTGALSVAGVIYLISIKDGTFTGTRLILTGIAIAAMLQSVITYMLSRAASWDLPNAMRWLSGSLNGTTFERVAPLAVALVVLTPLVASQLRALQLLRLGDDAASQLGVHTKRTRAILLICATVLVAFATAVGGPIAFVAFMAGPIATRLVGTHVSPVFPAALVGAILVLGGDFAAQNMLGTRYPVGVVTGAIGAPYLIFLLVHSNRQGSAQ